MRILPPSSKSYIIPHLAFFDLCWLIVSPFIALWLREPSFVDPSGLPFHVPITYQYAVITILSSVPFLLIFRLEDGLSCFFSSQDALAIFYAVFCSIMTSVFVVFYISRLEGIPRSVPIIFGLVLIFGLLSYRLLVRRLYENTNAQLFAASKVEIKHKIRRVIIVGLDSFAISAIRLFNNQIPRTVIVVSAISIENKHVGRKFFGIRILGGLKDLGSIIDEYSIHGVFIDEVWISDSSKYFNEFIFQSLSQVCRESGLKLKTLSHVLNLEQEPIHAGFFSNEKINLPTLKNSYFILKRILDIIFSATLLFLFFPIVIIIIIANFMLLGLPILFWQDRDGRFGNIIRIYKFRSIKVKKYSSNLPFSGNELSRYGSLLRRLRLDEIPQLLNILVGEMSIVGPRPLLPVDQPNNKIVRLLLRPGITGWAQINGGNKLTPEEKNALDCWYVYNISLKLDLSIILHTIKVVVCGMNRNEEAIRRAKAWMYEQKIS